MKTKILLPIAVVAFGVLSAFGTKDEGKGGAILGHSHRSASEPCRDEIFCGNNGGPVCTANGYDLYAETSPNVCPLPLSKNN